MRVKLVLTKFEDLLLLTVVVDDLNLPQFFQHVCVVPTFNDDDNIIASLPFFLNCTPGPNKGQRLVQYGYGGGFLFVLSHKFLLIAVTLLRSSNR